MSSGGGARLIREANDFLTRSVRLTSGCLQASQTLVEGWSTFYPLGVQPNMRLKLSAPSCCGGLLFVNMKAARRSLSAIR